MPKAVVTGGAGFIGSHVVDELLSKNYEVLVLDNMSTGNLDNISSDKVEVYRADVTGSPQSIAALIKGAECVFHLAAKTSVQESLDEPTPYFLTNSIGTANMLEACRLAEVKKFIYSSTSAVYGNTDQFPTSEETQLAPISPYALSKLMGEQHCQFYSEVYGVSTLCLRYFNVYGSRMNQKSSYRSVIPIFIDQFSKGEPLTITNDGAQARDFVHVEDVARANVAAMRLTGSGQPINIGTGVAISVNSIARMIGGKTQNIGFRLEPKISLASIDRAKRFLDWEPHFDAETWIRGQIT